RGVLGIVATRVVEHYGRPALIGSCDDSGQVHGSGRSISGFHLLHALESCRELFTRFGGHAHAAGFTLPADNVAELRARLVAYARSRLTATELQPKLHLDATVDLQNLNPSVVRELERLQPFGVGNPEPRFAARQVRVLTPPRILNEKHLKLKLAWQARENFTRGIDALGWRMSERAGEITLPAAVDIAFTVEQNSNPDFPGLQLNLLDLCTSAAAAGA
ncbi:MAG: single-stranded-DNA-specific exonuclease RecJ, partial [Acidobacteria bacterium]|nr:single-stranded-DNA-specific exonuclease RecJ [Acidobacteriota bacterium]